MIIPFRKQNFSSKGIESAIAGQAQTKQGRRSGITSGGGEAWDKNTPFCMLLWEIAQQVF